MVPCRCDHRDEGQEHTAADIDDQAVLWRVWSVEIGVDYRQPVGIRRANLWRGGDDPDQLRGRRINVCEGVAHTATCRA